MSKVKENVVLDESLMLKIRTCFGLIQRVNYYNVNNEESYEIMTNSPLTLKDCQKFEKDSQFKIENIYGKFQKKEKRSLICISIREKTVHELKSFKQNSRSKK